VKLKLKYDEPLSDFAFNFNLRRYVMDGLVRMQVRLTGRVFHSTTSHLSLSRFWSLNR